MKVERRNSQDERRIVSALIVDPVSLGRISDIWDKPLFRSKWSNLVGQWCVDYWRQYGKPPMRQIESLFEHWANKTREKETVEIVERFLTSLSDDYKKLKKEVNSDYVIDCAGRHFQQVKLERLKDEIEAHLAAGDVDKAQIAVDKHGKLEMGVGEAIDVLRNAAAIEDAFANKAESLVRYPEPLDAFFGENLARESLVAFEAVEKAGKTWALLDLAWRAMLQRRRVAFFEVGDMTQRQIMRRFMVRAAKQPIYPRKILWPTSVTKDGQVEHEVKDFTKPLDWRKAQEACAKIVSSKLRSDDAFLRLSCHPNSTITVKGIENQLDRWEREGWLADIVIIDYADILAPPPGYVDSREAVNATWKQLSALRQKRHCLVVTATQAKATAYKAKILTKEHFSEDKRKHAHVTGMVGLSATDEERENGIVRWNWIAARESEYSERRCAVVATCLPLAQPSVRAAF